jgi:hypothetical protein
MTTKDTTMTDLSQLAHPWRHTPDERGLPHLGTWDCPHCLISTGAPFDALCPDLVAARIDELRATLDNELRARIAELESQLSAKSEWEASQHKLAARVRADERAAVVDWIRARGQQGASNGNIEGSVIFGVLAVAIESGKHHEQPTEKPV